MAIVQRTRMFETNSSSSHTVSIAICDDQELLDTLDVNSEGVVTIHYGEFGWGIEYYRDAETKASYAATWATNNSPTPELHMAMLSEVIAEQTSADEVIFVNSGDEYHPYGYIDHQSSDEGSELFESKDKLRCFIFCTQSVLKIDNDNHL